MSCNSKSPIFKSVFSPNRTPSGPQDKKRGMMIAFEGMDRTGKTTQARLLTADLRSKNIPVEYIKFPDRSTETGKEINGHLTGKKPIDPLVLIKLFSQNRWEKFGYMMKKLEEGVSLVVDRYIYSGLAFASVSGFDVGEIAKYERDLPEPDIVFFLTSSEPMVNRRGFGREVFETASFQNRVNNTYKTLFSNRNNWVQIDCTQNISDTRRNVVTEYLDSFSRVNLSEPVGKFIY